MRQSRIITLLTDFGNQDAYVGIMKGVITSINPAAHIIDLCHSIPPQDVFIGAYLLSTSYKYFPTGTIHVAVVDPGVGSKRDIVCVEIRNCLFLVPDNGILSFIVQEEKPKRIVQVTNSKYFLPVLSHTFHGRDLFAPVAAHLSLGVKPLQLGNATGQLAQLDLPEPFHTKAGQLKGQIIYIDRFGNLITNITREHLAQYIRNHTQNSAQRSGMKSKEQGVRNQTPDTLENTSKYEIPTQNNTIKTILGRKKILGLKKTYTDVKQGEPLLLLGSAGFLEISVNQGNAKKYFKVDRGNHIIVTLVSS